jgi:hypothetical protein
LVGAKVNERVFGSKVANEGIESTVIDRVYPDGL